MYQSLRAKLSLLNISPPMLKRHFDFGNYYLFPMSGDIVVMNPMLVCIAPSDTMLEIIETDHLHLELNVFEKDILKVKAGYQFYCSRSYK
jgi:cobalt-zinc-cadmium efflux system membrane fusion protein